MSETVTMTDALPEFLFARFAEDEAVARAAIEDDGGEDGGFEDAYGDLIRPPSGVGVAQGGFGEAAARMIATYAVPRRVLAECEAKRRIVDRCGGVGALMPSEHLAQGVLSLLALPYADHPDFRPEWKP